MSKSFYTFILFIIISASSLIVNAGQPQVMYGYDASGNRISRQFIQPRSYQSPAMQHTTFNVYPTVVTDVINVTTQNEIVPNEFSYTVTNVSGNIVLSGIIQSQSTQIQVSLLQGYYILNIFSATKQYSFNFLKN